MHVVKPLFPAYWTEKDHVRYAQSLKMHCCIAYCDIPNSKLLLKDCIEDLMGRFFLRTHEGCCQITYCPFCGAKSGSHS